MKDGAFARLFRIARMVCEIWVHAVREFRKFAEQPLTLRGSEYAHATQELNKAIDRAEKLIED